LPRISTSTTISFYQVAKILNEKVGDLTAIHASGADWNLENTKPLWNWGSSRCIPALNGITTKSNNAFIRA
jgi:hypothetical protein